MTADEKFASLAPKPGPLTTVQLLPLKGIGNSIYASGQVAMRNGALVASGLVGGEVDLELAQECAWQCAINLLEAMKKNLGSLSKIESVVRLGVYVASADNFTSQHLVAHGASEVFLQVFGVEIGSHSRTAIGVKSLPLGSPVEVDAIFSLKAD